MIIKNAPAKINLALHVTGQRSDGYHLLDSVVVFANTVEASDTIVASLSEKDGFGLDGAFAEFLTLDHANLAIKARDYLRKQAITHNLPAPAVHISLTKRLPIASGIGGGSSNAATTIKVLQEIWHIPFSKEYIRASEIASTLGADVPICLYGKPLRATGIGDHISKLDHVPALHMVLVNCGAHILTPDVFKSLEEKYNPALYDLPDHADDFISWLRERTRNDLLAPALEHCPAIQTQLDALSAEGAVMAQMSGSGATCFGIFPSAFLAMNAAAAIQKNQPDWWVVSTKTGASAHKN